METPCDGRRSAGLQKKRGGGTRGTVIVLIVLNKSGLYKYLRLKEKQTVISVYCLSRRNTTDQLFIYIYRWAQKYMTADGGTTEHYTN